MTRKNDIKVILILSLLISFTTNLVKAITSAKIIFIHSYLWMNGTYVAIATLFGFLLSPFLVNQSDKYGRKYFLLGAYIVFLIGQIGFGFESNPWRVHFWKIISGIGEPIQISIITLLVSDTIDKKNLSKFLILSTLFKNIGFGLGRFIGGYVGINNFMYTFYFQFIMIILLFFMTLFTLKNIKNPKNIEHKSITKFKFNTKAKFLTYFMISVSLLISISKTSYTSLINLFINQSLHFRANYTANYMLIYAICITFSSLILLPRLQKKFSNNFIILNSLIIACCSIIMPFFIRSLISETIFTLIFITSISLFEPLVTIFIFKNTKKQDQSILISILSEMNAIGTMIGAIVASSLFNRNYFYPFIFASVVSFIGLLIFVTNVYKKKHKNIKS